MFSKHHLTKEEVKKSIAPGKVLSENVDLLNELNYSAESLKCFVARLQAHGELDLTEITLFMLNKKYPWNSDLINLSEIDINSAKSFLCILAALNRKNTLKEIADFLVKSGVDLNFQVAAGLTPLHIAAQYGATEVIRVLLDPRYRININSQDNMNSTPSRYAASHQRPSILALLAEAKADLSLAAFDGYVPIHEVAKNDNLECLQILLEFKVNLEQKLAACGFQQAPIHIAAEANSNKITKKLLEQKVDLTTFSDDGLDALHYAVFCNSTAVVSLLVKHSDKLLLDELSKDRYQYTAMGIAAEKNHIDCLKILLEAKADIDKPRKSDGTTPLHRAIVNKKFEAAQFIIEHSKNIFAKDNYGHSALYLADLLKLPKFAKLFVAKAQVIDLSEEDKSIIKTLTLPTELSAEVFASNKM